MHVIWRQKAGSREDGYDARELAEVALKHGGEVKVAVSQKWVDGRAVKPWRRGRAIGLRVNGKRVEAKRAKFMALVDEVPEDDQVELLMKQWAWVPVEEAFPALFDVPKANSVLCPQCLKWYLREECEEDHISQKWGDVFQTTCPEGHVVESGASLSAAAEKHLRKTAARDSDRRSTGIRFHG